MKKEQIIKFLSRLENEIDKKISDKLAESDSIYDVYACFDCAFYYLKNKGFNFIEELSNVSKKFIEDNVIVAHENIYLVKYKKQKEPFKILIYQEYDSENLFLNNFKLKLIE